MIPNDKRASAVGVDSYKGESATSVAALRSEVILLLAQTNSGITENLDTPFEVFSTDNLALKAGYGSIADRQKKLIFQKNPSARLFACLLSGDPLTGAAATATLTFAGTSALSSFNLLITQAGKTKTVGVSKGDTPEVIAGNANVVMNSDVSLLATSAVVSAVETFTANFKGTTGNEITLFVTDEDGYEVTTATHGISITVTKFSGGTGSTDVTNAIAAIPESIKPTRIINQESTTDNLDVLEAFAIARQDSQVAQRVIDYTGKKIDTTSVATVNAEYTVLASFADARINDEINSVLYCGNYGLAIDFVSEFVALRVAQCQNTPGIPAVFSVTHSFNKSVTSFWFNYNQRDLLLKKGLCNIELNTNTFKMIGACVLYHPEDDNLLSTSQPINFYDTDITSIGNMAYATKLEFDTNWSDKKFIEDEDISTADFIVKLNQIEGVFDKFIDQWVDYGFIRDAEYSKENKNIVFNSENTERIEGELSFKLAKTGRIYSFKFGFTK